MGPRLPFGRYRGRPLYELPLDYLTWLVGLDDLREPLRTHIEREYMRRCGGRGWNGADERVGVALPMSAALVPVAERIVARGFRSLATETHPDAGGDHERMVLLNQAHEALRALLRGPA